MPILKHKTITKLLLSLATFAPIFLTFSSSALANPYETTLKNGLRIIVKEDRRAPTVAHMVWYKVGSMDEVDGTSGVAHVLEHMMFKGTPKVGSGEFSKRVAAAGGRDNAFTSHDYTAYFQQIPKEKLPEMMQLEADRMRHLTVDAKEFAQEIKVVMEERRMRTDDQPQSKLYEQLMATAFQAHPYRRPIIGWMRDLEEMTAIDARAWYDRWYVPNNATLVVVGDVGHQDVFQLAEQTYGKLASRPLPVRRSQDEPEQKGMRRLVLKAPAELPLVALGFKVPVLRDVEKDNDSYALSMLAAVLDGHDAARFKRHLVRERGLAVDVDAHYDDMSRGPALFMLQGTPTPGTNINELEAALRAEISEVVQNGITDDELRRAKAQLMASQIYKLDSMFGQAMEIGQAEISGISWRLLPRTLEKLQAVTGADIQRVAKQYFGDDGLTVAVLEPQALNNAPRRPASGVKPRH